MNDRLKYRVWDKKQKKYLNPKNYLIALTHTCELFELNCDGSKTKLSENDFTIEQCTGYKDKHGKLIYDGDKIKDSELNKTLIVKYNKNHLTFICYTEVSIDWGDNLGYIDQHNCPVCETCQENREVFYLSEFFAEEYFLEKIGTIHDEAGIMKCETCGEESGNQAICDECWEDYLEEFGDDLECPECDGSGTTIEGRSCDACQGTGKISG